MNIAARASVAWLAFVALVAPLHVAGQALQGEVVDEETGAPVSGVVVTVLDEGSTELAATLTGEDGSFRFLLPGTSSYSLRAEMIGRQTVEAGPFRVADEIRHELNLPAQPIRLDGLDVTGEQRCSVDMRSARAVYTVWTEIQKALRATDVTRTRGQHRFLVAQYDRRRDRRSLEILSEVSSEEELAGVRRPFRSLSPIEIGSTGYVRTEDGYFWIYGPTTEVLQSSGFVRSHCFSIIREDSRPGEVGIAFEPAKERSVTELKGVLWVDEQTARLRALEFEYVNLPDNLMDGDYSGAMQFRVLEEGGVIVSDWWLRTPDPENLNQIREQAGSVLRIRPGQPQ